MNIPVEFPHATRLLELVNGNWTTQAVGVAAELGLADHLAEGALDTAALASLAGCDRDSLERLLRALVSLEVLAEDGEGRYALTAMGALLKRDAWPSMRSWAIYTALHSWHLWGRLLDSVRTGTSARKLLAGREGYAHLEEDATTAAVFNRAMEEITHFLAGNVARTLDFAALHEVVDVGGGHGELLASILRAHPHLRGVVFDLAHAAPGAARVLQSAGVAGRARIVSGSFFDSIPPGADAYLLKSIIHNWDDTRAAQILGRCRDAAKTGARIVLVERVLPERITGSAAERATLRSDINMMVGLGGRERTAAHMAAMLTQSGFGFERCVPVGFGFSVLEAVTT